MSNDPSANAASNPKKTANGAAGKTLWVHTKEGKAKLSAAQKLARKRNPNRDTRKLSDSVVRQMEKLADEGLTLREVSKRMKLGYSTVQRYVRESRVGKAVPRSKDSGNGRISDATKKRIDKMLAAVPPILVTKIAAATGVHISSVYARRKLQGTAPQQEVGDVAQGGVAQGISARAYQEFRHANKETWRIAREEERELTDGEIYFVMAWRRAYEEQAQGDDE